MSNPKRARTARREQERALEKLGRDREKLARLEAGGTPEYPVDVVSASQIEPHALGLRCLRCNGPYRLEEHAAIVVDHARLRLTRLACTRCGARREAWFRIGSTGLN